MIYSIDYSLGYSEGDNPSSVPSTVTSEEIQLLNNKLDLLLQNSECDNCSSVPSTVTSEEIQLLNNKLDLLLQNCENLATKNYIDSKIPFVDDMSLKAFKAGQIVTVFGFGNVECTVMSSQLLPIDVDNYIVIYTVRYIDGENVYTSNFPASHCTLKV